MRRGAGIAAVAGLLSGGLGAYAYYDFVLRPLAHTLGLWLVVTIAVAPRRPQRAAMLNATVALTVAVVAFYVGKKVMYGVRYPGMPYALDLAQIALWLVLAVAAGLGLGLLFSLIGRPDRAGSLAAAAGVGLLLADALRRVWSYGGDLIVVVPAVAGVVLVVVLTPGPARRPGRLGLLVVPATVLALMLVSAPDVLEDVVGFL